MYLIWKFSPQNREMDITIKTKILITLWSHKCKVTELGFELRSDFKPMISSLPDPLPCHFFLTNWDVKLCIQFYILHVYVHIYNSFPKPLEICHMKIFSLENTSNGSKYSLLWMCCFYVRQVACSCCGHLICFQHLPIYFLVFSLTHNHDPVHSQGFSR